MNKTSKGKLGTRGMKTILEENAQTMKIFFYAFAGSNVIYLILRFLFFWESFSGKFIALYSLTLLVQTISYFYMNSMSTPIYADDNKTIIDPGSDLNMIGHISEYLKDAILFPIIVYAFSLYTNYAWLLLLVVPIYAFVKLWKSVIGPWIFAPAPEDGQEPDQKKVKEKKKVIRVR
jgi:hypothetical protein